MAAPKHSKIGWTDFSGGDANFIIGCSPVSPGCANCYAARWARRWGRDFGPSTDLNKLYRLEEWKPQPPACGQYKRGPETEAMCFVVDLGDFLHAAIRDGFICEALDVFWNRRDIVWQILTKRAWRLNDFIFPPSCWVGVSVETQDWAETRVNELMHCDFPEARFVSVEPMLGPVDLSPWLADLDWVICGAESGPKRRAFDPRWAADLYDQCREVGVPFFGKQDSGLRPGEPLVLPGVGEVREWPPIVDD